METTERFLFLQQIAERWTDTYVRRYGRKSFTDPVIIENISLHVHKLNNIIFFRYDIFSEGPLQGTSSSISSSLSSPAVLCPAARLIVDPQNMSGTGNMLGLRSAKNIKIKSGSSSLPYGPVRYYLKNEKI